MEIIANAVQTVPANQNVLFIQNKELVSIYKDYFLYLFSSIDKKYLILFPVHYNC